MSSWRDAPAVLRKLSLGLWGAAVALGFTAMIIEAAGGWGDLPFVTNLTSQGVSAMIALPIALLVVSRLAAYQVEEATQQRRAARIRTLRSGLARAAGELKDHLEATADEATASANALIRVVQGNSGDEPDGASIDLKLVDEAARSARSVMSNSERVLFQRFIRPVRERGDQLHSALIERMDGSEADEEIQEFERLTNAWESAVESHQWHIDQGQGLFGHRPALPSFDRSRVTELRNAAVGYIRSFDELSTRCQELEHFAAGPNVTRR